MAELEQPTDCCTPTAQAECCEPGEKHACCGPGGGCDCAPGADAVREQVNPGHEVRLEKSRLEDLDP
jgi:hypothetical protein